MFVKIRGTATPFTECRKYITFALIPVDILASKNPPIARHLVNDMDRIIPGLQVSLTCVLRPRRVCRTWLVMNCKQRAFY